ncbi:MAG: hypothetical protein ABR924_09710 [Terracidiphilus sp.]
MTETAKGQRPEGGRVLGFPLEGFGLFTSLLLAVAAAFFTFFATTCIAIFSLLAWNLFGHHAVSYADLSGLRDRAGGGAAGLWRAVGKGEAAEALNRLAHLRNCVDRKYIGIPPWYLAN